MPSQAILGQARATARSFGSRGRRSIVRWLDGDSPANDLSLLLARAREAPPITAAPDSSHPLELSVVVPTYNRPSMLRRALRSVAEQRPARAGEVIVVDDGSTEDLEGVAREYGAKLIRHPTNRGLSAARNTGVEAAKYPWVALLDSDDEWLPHHLATLWPLRDGHLLVASSAFRCGIDPRNDRVQGTLRRSPVVLRSPAGLLYPANFICPSAVMVRRDAILAAGGFESRQGVVEDLLLWCRLLDRGTGVASPTVSLRYHIHDEQMTSDFERMHAAHLMVAESMADRKWWSPAVVERRRGYAAWGRFREYSARGDWGGALHAAAGILGHPQRIIGVLGTWIYRLRRRRRTGRVRRDGLPSIVVLGEGSDDLARAVDALGPLPVSDWRGVGPLRALLRLARRPPAVAVVDSLPQYAVVRLAGVRPLRAAALPQQGAPGAGPLPPG